MKSQYCFVCCKTQMGFKLHVYRYIIFQIRICSLFNTFSSDISAFRSKRGGSVLRIGAYQDWQHCKSENLKVPERDSSRRQKASWLLKTNSGYLIIFHFLVPFCSPGYRSGKKIITYELCFGSGSVLIWHPESGSRSGSVLSRISCIRIQKT